MKKILNSLLLIGIFSLLAVSYVSAQSNLPLTSQDSLVPCQAAYEGTWKYEDKKTKTLFIVRIKTMYEMNTARGNKLYSIRATY